MKDKITPETHTFFKNPILKEASVNNQQRIFLILYSGNSAHPRRNE